jgi:succinate dehydrogenase / fumarate reductase iron-sulfur subunit
MRINGQTALACKVRVNSLKSSLITLEPLAGLPVVKDLVVDQKPFFDQYLQIEPFLSGTENQTKQPPIGSVKAFLLPEVTAACIQCAACTTACPVWRKDHQYLGPAFLVWMHRYIFDPCDQLAETRKELISKEDGIWRCRNAYQCTLCCPQSIPITRAIAEIRIKLIKEKI